jgi:hypothetical protein
MQHREQTARGAHQALHALHASLMALNAIFKLCQPPRLSDAHQPTLYAVRSGAALQLRFVDFDEGRLILRPYSRAFPVQLIPLASHESPADYLVGRVCLVFSEL